MPAPPQSLQTNLFHSCLHLRAGVPPPRSRSRNAGTVGVCRARTPALQLPARAATTNATASVAIDLSISAAAQHVVCGPASPFGPVERKGVNISASFSRGLSLTLSSLSPLLPLFLRLPISTRRAPLSGEAEKVLCCVICCKENSL